MRHRSCNQFFLLIHTKQSLVSVKTTTQYSIILEGISVMFGRQKNFNFAEVYKQTTSSVKTYLFVSSLAVQTLVPDMCKFHCQQLVLYLFLKGVRASEVQRY